MKKFLLAIVISSLFVAGCKKEEASTGVKLNISGASTFKLEILKGSLSSPITNIEQWRPDVVFWAVVPNQVIELSPGLYTIIVQNLDTEKIINVPVSLSLLYKKR